MKILLHDRSGHPFQVQLSRELARRGHQVVHSYAAFFQSPRGALQPRAGDPPRLKIIGMELRKPFKKYSYVRRLLQEREYASLLTKHVQDINPEVVIFSNVPPSAQAAVMRTLGPGTYRFVFWVQDLYGLAIGRIIAGKNRLFGIAAGAYFTAVERSVMRKSHRLILITEDFAEDIRSAGVDEEKLTVIPNWAPLEELSPGAKQNELSVRLGLEDKFCFLYSGTLGMKHNPDLLVRIALKFRDDPEVRVVVVSEGIGADWLRQEKERRSLHNLMILGFQPFESMPALLASADVLIGILEPEAGRFSVPSKVLTYLCAARPILLSVPSENLAARIVSDHRAGLVADSLDADSFTDAAGRLYVDGEFREQCAKNGRKYAEEHFDIRQIGDRFEDLLRGVVAHPSNK